MRPVYQALRHWLILNATRSMTMDGMMDHCEGYPQLLHCKRIMLHDKALYLKEIDDVMDKLADGTFRFRYRSRKEMGKNWNPMILWEEDCAGITWTKWILLGACRELKGWLEKNPVYVYPAEQNG